LKINPTGASNSSMDSWDHKEQTWARELRNEEILDQKESSIEKMFEIQKKNRSNREFF
jgi:hypothetical protein